VKTTDRKNWNANASKDTFWNFAVLIGGLLILIAGVVDLPHGTANQVALAAHQQTAAAR
jgi:hypothetical protein